jgi:hypothetical protein
MKIANWLVCSKRGTRIIVSVVVGTLSYLALLVLSSINIEPVWVASKGAVIDPARGIQWQVGRRDILASLVFGIVERQWEISEVFRPGGAPEEDEIIETETIISPTRTLPTRFYEAVQNIPEHGSFVVIESGFPLRAHILAVWESNSGASSRQSDGILGRLTGHAWHYDVPVSWNAIAVLNLLIISWMIYVLAGLCTIAIVRHRLRSGLCCGCSYPVSSHERCAECGRSTSIDGMRVAWYRVLTV